MADQTKVFGVKIILDDYSDPVTQNTAIGLYNVQGTININAVSGNSFVLVSDASGFYENTKVYIYQPSTAKNEVNVVTSVSGNQINLLNALQNDYYAISYINAGSEFRWIQNNITGVSTWKTGIIVKNGIKNNKRSVDLRFGGAVASNQSSGVEIQNTNQFFQTLKDNEIYLNGLIAEIHEFTDSVNDRIAYMEVSGTTWNAKKYTINFKGLLNKRIANLTTQVNSTNNANASGNLLGQTIPAVYGQIKPIYDTNDNIIYNGYAQTQQISDNVTTFSIQNEYFFDTNLKIKIFNNELLETSAFPVVGDSGDPPLIYKIKIAPDSTFIKWYTALDVEVTTGQHQCTALENYILNVITGTSQNKYRVITDCYVDLDIDSTVLVATVNEYFEENLSGNATATALDQSWVKFISKTIEYKVDNRILKSFISKDGEEITSNIPVYQYDSKKTAQVTTENTDADVIESNKTIAQLPALAFQPSDSNNNKFTIDKTMLSGYNGSEFQSFITFPMDSYRFSDETAADLTSKWSFSGSSGFIKLTDGLYVNRLPTSYSMTGDINSLGSKVYFGSGIQANIERLTTDSVISWLAVICKPTDISNIDFEFDKVYLAITYNSGYLGKESDRIQFIPKYRKMLGSATTIKDDATNAPVSIVTGIQKTVANIAKNYYTDQPAALDGNERFWHIKDGEEIDDSYYTNGYSLYELPDIKGIDDFKQIYEIGIFSVNTVYNNPVSEPSDDFAAITQVGLIFRKKSSIKDKLFLPVSGRKFNTTWDSRKTSENLIESPVDIFEDICRSQNFSDVDITPSDNWGIDQATNPLIKTSGDGSFDDITDPLFSALKTEKTSFQIINKFNNTKSLKQQLCLDWFFVNFQDEDGKECLKSIRNSETSPSDIITLSDIVDRNTINITERQAQDIYCEMEFKYNYNYAAQKYEGSFSISNTSAETYNSSYVKGLSGTQAEEYWNKCRTLYKKTRRINIIPAQYAEKYTINGVNAESNAKSMFLAFIDWQFNPEITFQVHYNKANTWKEGHKFIIQLPHQTNNTQIECILEEIDISYNRPYYITIKAIMLSDTIPSEYYLKDTWNSTPANYDWKDNWTNYGNDNDKIDTY